jgi:hypothetical protein
MPSFPEDARLVGAKNAANTNRTEADKFYAPLIPALVRLREKGASLRDIVTALEKCDGGGESGGGGGAASGNNGGASIPVAPTLPSAPQPPPTVLGPDGKKYSFESYIAAQKKFEGQQKSAEGKSAYDAFFGPPPLPKKPEKDGNSKSEIFQEIANQLGLGKAFKAVGGATGAGASGVAMVAGIGAAVYFGAEQVNKSLTALRQGVDLTAETFGGLAKNQLPDMRKITDSFADTLGASIPIFGDVVAALLKLPAAIADVPKKIIAGFLERANEIRDWSPSLTVSGVRNEVRNMHADRREASVLGPGLSRMENAQTDLLIEIRNALLPLKKLAIDFLAPAMETLAKMLQTGNESRALLAKTLEVQIAIAESNVAVRLLMGHELAQMKELVKLTKGENDDLDDNSLINGFFDAARAARPAAMG